MLVCPYIVLYQCATNPSSVYSFWKLLYIFVNLDFRRSKVKTVLFEFYTLLRNISIYIDTIYFIDIIFSRS